KRGYGYLAILRLTRQKGCANVFIELLLLQTILLLTQVKEALSGLHFDFLHADPRPVDLSDGLRIAAAFTGKKYQSQPTDGQPAQSFVHLYTPYDKIRGREASGFAAANPMPLKPL